MSNVLSKEVRIWKSNVNVLSSSMKKKPPTYIVSNLVCSTSFWNKGNNNITELRTILQRESQNS